MLATLMAFPAFADETYTGAGAGKNGKGSIEASVTLNDEKVITGVKVTKNGDDAGISDPAVEKVPAEIVKNNSLAVDTVTGATLTSNGILAAMEAALVVAGVNPDDYKAVDSVTAVEKSAVTESTDVLVIGAGMAGLTAALSAKQNDANVVIIDKMAMAGGTTKTAGGILVCVGF